MKRPRIASLFAAGVRRFLRVSLGKRPIWLTVIVPLSIAIVAAVALARSKNQPQDPGLFVGAAAAATPTSTPSACVVPGGYVKLSDCIGTDANKTVIIGDGVEKGTGACEGSNINAYVDEAGLAIGRITINSGSTLALFSQTAQQAMSLNTTGIDVFGTLQIGNSDCPIGTNNPLTKVTITFTGDKDPTCVDNSCGGYVKGVQVEKGGVLRMYGLKGAPTSTSPAGMNWTYLSAPAAVGANKLMLADDVTQGTNAWQKNDWIAVGSTSFSPYDTEIVKIVNIQSKPADNPTGSDIFIQNITKAPPTGQVLTHFHFGSQAPEPAATYPSAASYNDGPPQNYGVDERAPVALLSRNIKLTSDAHPVGTSSHWGGEMKFLPAFTEVSVQGVEVEKFGKDKLGSYPFHFHMDGPIGGKVLVNSNSVHHSYNKGITVHSTQNLTISNNVVVRAVGHLFYEEIGDETGTTFDHNLGMGAMSNWFDINDTDKMNRNDLISKYWWTGDYMTNNPTSPDYNQYDGFNIPDTDATTNPVHGSCAQINQQGQLFGYTPADSATNKCAVGNPYYVEPASGFWITNQGTKLTGNIVDGCQGAGVGYWYVSPGNNPTYPQVNNNQLLATGTFRNNRVVGCFDGLFGENAYSITSAQLPHPTTTGDPNGQNIIATFDGLTATRIRDRGVWLRDQWFVINNGRFATSRDSASLVTAGGIDGSTPGDWMLVENSVFEGISQNKVDRFGPCPMPGTTFSSQQPLQGCVDLTPTLDGMTPHSGDEIGKGYPDPSWNPAGYMIYDGPARLKSDRFVNFKVNIKKELTATDDKALTAWENAHKLENEKGKPVDWVYEGDAALGWFQSNQSSYPTVANSSNLSFVNTDLRHQIYTQLVNLGKAPGNPASGFGDGDKNTSIIDLDGTLSGFIALDAKENPPMKFDDFHPISLNNLMINASSNSVDECHSRGGQDAVLEKRPTSLMSPSSMATLELQMLYPPTDIPAKDKPPPPYLQKQNIKFTKDSLDFDTHQSMTLSSRNALGVWEPKVTSGLGYTIEASINTADKGTKAGIPSVVEVGLVDTYKPHISPGNPFYVRVGICFANKNGRPKDPALFTITRGYHSYGGGVVKPTAVFDALRPYYNKLVNMYQDPDGNKQNCDNLVGTNLDASNPPQPVNLLPGTGCPANGIIPMSGSCTPPTTKGKDLFAKDVCVYPKSTLTAVPEGQGIEAITNPDGSYKDLTKYYYDSGTGWLFFYVAQQDPNPVGPSPIASCGGATKDPACPNNANGETYYVCPPEGCTDYVVRLNDSSYTPDVSTCPSPYPAYKVPQPKQPYHLAYLGGTTSVTRENAGTGTDFPHYTAQTAPVCK